ncbi:MAG: TIGR02281 family clan AA aspartic protease [Halioglobus sp.]
MRRLSLIYLLGLLASFTALPSVAQTTGLEVQALFPNAAVVMINGERQTLRAGDTKSGITLIEADARVAVFEINGKKHELGVSQRISSNYVQPEKRQVTIKRDARLQYNTTASINGKRTPVLVDTGANLVALSSQQATRLGIDYTSGMASKVETASGLTNAWRVTLGSVDVGGIAVENVQASVIEGDYPTSVLLGMSYLRHVEMRESGGVLMLSREW